MYKMEFEIRDKQKEIEVKGDYKVLENYVLTKILTSNTFATRASINRNHTWRPTPNNQPVGLEQAGATANSTCIIDSPGQC